MAKISTYPILSTPTLNDMLIGTDVENFNETKNFLISDIANFILADNFVPYVGADKNLNLGIHSVIANSFIVNSGTATQFLKANGTLDSTVYQPAGNYITQLSGEATASGPGNAAITLSNAAVIGKVLTGLTITGDAVVATDSIISAFGKVQNQINTLIGGVQYKGTWNAATNTPTLESSVGVAGHYFVVSVDGNTNLNGITDWKLGDWAIFNGSAWEKVDNTDAVISVNGQIGAVVLTTTNIAEGTNLYYTDARVRNALSLTATGNNGASTYNAATGVFNVPEYTLAGLAGVPLTRQITINGVAQDLSADRSYNVGTVTSVATSSPLTGGTITGAGTLGITQAGAATDGFLSSTDWNTFNNKQNTIVNPVTGTGTALTLPMWGSASSLVNSPLSFLSDAFTFQYNSLTGATVVFSNNGLTAYTYSIQMNNFGSPRSTIHSYTDGIIVETIAGVQVSRVFANGNTVFGAGVADNGHKLELNGSLFVNTIENATIDTDKFLVSDSGVIKYRTGTELLSDIDGVPSSRTLTINGVTQDLSADRTFTIATHDAVTIGTANGLSLIGQQLSLGLSSGSANGALSSVDFTTFNAKEPAITVGTSLQYFRGDKTFQTLNTAAVPELTNLYFTENRVRTSVLTGLNLASGGTIAATDNVLVAFGKVQNQISALVGGVMYDGLWNASTNTPTLASGVGTKGDYYVVSVAGSTNIDGITDWEIGDWIIFNGTTWDKVDNTDAVSSVNGYTGTVSLVTGDVLEGAGSLPSRPSQLYFTDTRARAALSAGTGISYNSTTGVITNSAPDQTVSITAGSGISVSGAYPSFTVASTITQYTDALARAAISLTTSGSSGASTYNSSTGVLNIPNYSIGVLSLGAIGTNPNANGATITGTVLNLQPASISFGGVVTTGTQTFEGFKIFNGTIGVDQDIRLVTKGTALNTFITNINATGLTSIGSNGFGFNNANNIYFSGSNKGGGVFAFSNTGTRTYTLQDASGTLAFTSDIPSITGLVTLDTVQTITAQKTITTSGIEDTLIINHTSGSGNAVTITGGSDFFGRISAISGANTINLTANVSGQSNRLETTGALPLALVSSQAITLAAGGVTPQLTISTAGVTTLTGALNGTSASFTDNVTIDRSLSTLGNALTLTKGSDVDQSWLAFQQGAAADGVWRLGYSGDPYDFRISVGSNASIGTQALRIFETSQNVVIGTSTSDNGARLQVSGTTSLTGALNGTSAVFSSNVTMGGNDSVATRLYVRTEDAANTPSLTLFKNVFTTSTEDVFRVTSVAVGGAFTTTAAIKANGDATFSSSVTSNGLFVSGIGGTTGFARFTDDVTASMFVGINSGTPYIHANNSTLSFGANGNNTFAPTMTLSAGNVGIGTTTPATFSIASNLVVDSGANGGGITIKTGTTASTSNYGGVYFADGTTGNEQFRGFIQYNHNFTGISDALLFGTSNTERMRIFANGNVAIQDTFVDNGAKLCITSGAKAGMRILSDATHDAISIGGTGALRMDFPGVGGGRFEINDSGTAFLRQYSNGTLSISSGQVVSSSDKNLKTDDGSIENALEKILQLNPRYFYWKENSGIETNERQLGFYAQDVHQVLGEEVANQNSNGKWGIYDRGIVAMLTKAIQEQQSQIEILKNQMQ